MNTKEVVALVEKLIELTQKNISKNWYKTKTYYSRK